MTTSEEVPGELVEEFQVEELEERVEFADWGASVECEGTVRSDGPNEASCSGKVTVD